MSTTEEYEDIKNDYYRLISECQETRRASNDKLELHRTKVTQELRAMRKERDSINDQWDKKARNAKLYGVECMNKFENQDSEQTIYGYDGDDELCDIQGQNEQLGYDVRQSLLVSYSLRDLIRNDSLEKIIRIHQRSGTMSVMDQNILNLLKAEKY